MRHIVPYDSEILLIILGQYNATHWPLHLLMGLLVLVIFAQVMRPFICGHRIVFLGLSLFFFVTGIRYLGITYAMLNWIGPFYGFGFVLQGGFFFWLAVRQEVPVPHYQTSHAGRFALFVLIYAAVGHSLLEYVLHGSPPGIQTVGLTPTPTILFTLGILLFVPKPLPGIILIIPLLWSGYTLYWSLLLEMPERIALGFLCLTSAFWVLFRQIRNIFIAKTL